MTHRALVVGLGQIGLGYDLDHDPSASVLTHARAFQTHPAYELVGGVDGDPARRRLLEHRYQVPAFATVAEAMKAAEPEVAAVATPTGSHLSDVRAALATGSCTAILCEKPLAYNLAEARAICDLCATREVELFVNYIRRCDPAVSEVKRRFDAGLIALPITGVVWYSKGIFNNGSHFLNLLEHWAGPVTEFRIVDSGDPLLELDPEPVANAIFPAGSVWFLPAREEHFSHYTIEIVAANGRLRYDRGGERISWEEVVTDQTCEGYRVLSPQEETIPSALARIQWHVADEMSKRLAGEASPICTGREALRTVEVLSTTSRPDVGGKGG